MVQCPVESTTACAVFDLTLASVTVKTTSLPAGPVPEIDVFNEVNDLVSNVNKPFSELAPKSFNETTRLVLPAPRRSLETWASAC